MPKVSVIVPVYGVEKYIERCARSLFEQTLDDIEYLFIDDCTPDRSIDILKNVLDEYPFRKKQAIIHRMEQNSGQAAVRKWGMQNATGDYIVHCDSDDWVELDMYKTMYERAIDESADIVVCNFKRTNGIDYNKIEKGCHSINKSEYIENCIFQKDHWSLWNKIISRELLNSANITYPQDPMGEDMAIFFQLVCNCKKISYVDEAYYNYFCNNGSITKKNSESRCLNNYRQLKNNTSIVINMLENGSIECRNTKLVIPYLRLLNAMSLLRVLHIKEYKKIWDQECKNLPFFSFMSSTLVPAYIKYVYVMATLHIYPTKKMRAQINT